MDNSNQVKGLLDKFETLINKQSELTTELQNLKTEIQALDLQAPEVKIYDLEAKKEPLVSPKPELEPQVDRERATPPKAELLQSKARSRQPSKKDSPTKAKSKLNFEKFIGENLINKIGIVILILGLAIGTKYSIEHDLISPLTRIILGYLAGLTLLIIGLKLKQKYLNYSAVLVSGATASLYFITYFAYDFYGFLPQFIAFGLMVIFTGFTIFTALNYNKQVIGLLGFVGAYSVPFLLSDGSGNVLVLFIYMTIINIGILILAFKKDWKSLYYSAFGVTWIIYSAWYFWKGDTGKYYILALVFLTVFFLIFYITFLAYQILKQVNFSAQAVFMLLANSFIFYGLGYIIITKQAESNFALGLFTVGNACIHLGFSYLVKQKHVSAKLQNFITGLFLVFITLTIPVQLDGVWVTFCWALEAVLLFGIGRIKQGYIYEKLDYGLIVLDFVSLIDDCVSYDHSQTIFLNFHFSISLMTTAAFGIIYLLKTRSQFASPLKPDNLILKLSHILLPTILILTTYLTFFMEIRAYWDQVQEVGINRENLKIVWLISYSLCFSAGLTVLNFRKIQSKTLVSWTLVLGILGVGIFLTTNLFLLDELRADYLIYGKAAYLWARYIALISVGLFLRAFYQHSTQTLIDQNFDKLVNYLFHLTILWTASNEVIHWFALLDLAQSYKFGLSVLWGAYALLLISLGIRNRKKYLRITAISLLALTLLKLFVYDLADLGTIAKTIAFIALGLLLLVISFLYNKYKERLFKD